MSVVIPVFDEAENMTPFVKEIETALANLGAFEVIFIDDGSTDATARILSDLRTGHSWLRLLRHDRRAGKSAALRTGIKAARAETVVTLDGDRQNDPADIPALLDRFETARTDNPKLALLAGQRTKRRDTVIRRLSSRIANGVRARVLGDATRDTACGFKIIRRDVFLDLPYFDGLHRFLPALAKAQGFEVMVAPVTDRPRAAGVAKYGVWNRLWVGIMDMLAVYWLIRRCHLPRNISSQDDEAAL